MFKYVEDAQEFLANVIVEAEMGMKSGDAMLEKSARVIYGLASLMSLAFNGVSLTNKPPEDNSNAEPEVTGEVKVNGESV